MQDLLTSCYEDVRALTMRRTNYRLCAVRTIKAPMSSPSRQHDELYH
jgi:hypothetical protein